MKRETTLRIWVGSFFLFSLLGMWALDKKDQQKNLCVDQEVLRKKLSQLSEEELKNLAVAGKEVLYWYHILERVKSNPVKEVLKDQTLCRKNHYPKGDVIDWENHSHYYYHVHRKGEEGHFHLFLRPNSEKKKEYAHLVGISMDKKGLPIKLFTTNQWVTGGKYLEKERLCSMIDQFKIEDPEPSLALNQCLNAMVRLFRPQIAWLIRERDEKIELKEILSEEPVSLSAQIEMIQEILKQ